MIGVAFGVCTRTTAEGKFPAKSIEDVFQRYSIPSDSLKLLYSASRDRLDFLANILKESFTVMWTTFDYYVINFC